MNMYIFNLVGSNLLMMAAGMMLLRGNYPLFIIDITLALVNGLFIVQKLAEAANQEND